MEENKNLNNEIDETVAEIGPSEMSQEEIKKAIGDFLTKERGQSMILGYRVACQTVLQMIAQWHKPNCSHREYERIFKRLEKFCGKALKRDDDKNEDSETIQNELNGETQE